MAEKKVQVNFQMTPADAAALDALAHKDGYDKRAGWLRREIRAVLDERRAEIVPVSTTLPNQAEAVAQGR